MSRILELYDTDETLLANSLRDFLESLRLDVIMIPREPHNGRPLGTKAWEFFRHADGAVFLLTPGCARKGRQYPSPSVVDELRLAEERFRRNPERVIYLKDRECNLPPVNMRSWIEFSRPHLNLSTGTELIRELKASGLLKVPRQVQPVLGALPAGRARNDETATLTHIPKHSQLNPLLPPPTGLAAVLAQTAGRRPLAELLGGSGQSSHTFGSSPRSNRSSGDRLVDVLLGRGHS